MSGAGHMGQVTRRGVLRLGGAAALAVALPPVPASSRPVIFADGLRDDSPALRALLSGAPVDFASPAARHGIWTDGERVAIRDSHLRITEGFAVSGPVRTVTILGCVIRSSAPAVFDVSAQGSARVEFRQNLIDFVGAS